MISNLKSCATDGNFNMQIIHEYYIPITADIFRNCPKIQLWGGRAPASLILYKKCKIKTIILVILIDKGVNRMSSICCKTSQTPNKTNGNNNSEWSSIHCSLSNPHTIHLGGKFWQIYKPRSLLGLIREGQMILKYFNRLQSMNFLYCQTFDHIYNSKIWLLKNVESNTLTL